MFFNDNVSENHTDNLVSNVHFPNKNDISQIVPTGSRIRDLFIQQPQCPPLDHRDGLFKAK